MGVSPPAQEPPGQRRRGRCGRRLPEGLLVAGLGGRARRDVVGHVVGCSQQPGPGGVVLEAGFEGPEARKPVGRAGLVAEGGVTQGAQLAIKVLDMHWQTPR